jgi:phosphoribosylanthranilate isomerase
MLGFIFYPKSPRNIAIEDATHIAAHLRGAYPRLRLVGVFVNRSARDMLAVLQTAHLDLAQLSGDESSDVLLAMQSRAYKAVRDEAVAQRFLQINSPHASDTPQLLLDANHPQLYGGSGMRAEQSLAQRLACEARLLLAGGLTPDNVREAITHVRPWGVDVASGVEASPGKKDHAKVRAFVQAAKTA